MILRITNGTTTLVLHSDSGAPALGLYGVRYFPSKGDGGTVTETIDVVFSGVSDAVLSAMSTVQRLIAEAATTPVYLEYALVPGGTVYRSPVVSGRVVWSSERQNRQFWATTTAGECAVIITRSDYWESATETTLVDGVNITNGTASPYNAVTLASVGGDLPTPISVELQSNNAATMLTRNVYLNMDSFAGLTTNQHLVTSGAGAKSWGTGLTYNQLLWTLTPSATVVAKLAGKAVSIIAAFSALPSDMYLRAALYSLYSSVYQQIAVGVEQYANGQLLINLGTLQFPEAAHSGLVVVVAGYRAAAGSATMSFVQLMPAKGGVRLDVTHEWKFQESIIYRPDTAFYDTGLGQYSNVSRAGGPLMAWPGRTNRLSVLAAESAAFNASRQTIVTVKARPRRSTV